MNNRLLERFREYINVTQFNAIRFSLASPDKIRSLSYGEVKKIETINYRTLKPEKDGLFCARIFGPVKDWECNCGKYKRMKHRGVTCEKCGVEVIQSRVRRERMGHIDLVAPVCHIWYLKGIPSYLGLVMDLSVKDLERVIYFDCSIVVTKGDSPYPEKTLLTNSELEAYLDLHPDDLDFRADSGAQAVRDILKKMDLAAELAKLHQDYETTNSVATKHKIIRRLRALTGLSQAKLRPEWMIFDVLPVLPPDLRPLVPIDGGRFASSDLNELYRRVLNRNIRLRRLHEIEAPAVIIRNEKRMLQESVDALIDNGRRGQPVRGSNKRSLKSLSEMLRGKQGRFRQNLLGKRVDYSGRSVIVVDPELKMDQCGLPKKMALELFKSYIYAGLLQREMAVNLRVAKKMVEDGAPEIWDVLEDIVKTRPVLLNRAPTLHRLGIQAFHPILVDGKAIKIHPLVCAAFNADFDGDQMAVHIPLSDKACEESENLMLSTKNVLSPSNGRPITVPSQDMILGLHYITKVRCNVLGEGVVFSSPAEVMTAFECGSVSVHARIKLRLESGAMVETSVGRVVIFDALPEGSDFDWINKVLQKKDLRKLIEIVYYQFGQEKTVVCLDKIKKLGFYYSTISGVSCGIADLVSPPDKDELIHKAEKEVDKINKLYKDGIITDGERYNKVLSTWFHATSEISNSMLKTFRAQDHEAFENKKGANVPFNSVYMFLNSGARGTNDQIKQLVGMRGLMARPSGDIMETPVKANFKDGLSVFEYFISTHGARKGQADTALKTANSGYLTRRLVDVAQNVVITTEDCASLGYIGLRNLAEGGEISLSSAERAYGRVCAVDLHDVISGELLVKQDDVFTRELVQKLENSVISEIFVRSVLTCQSKRGVCVKCYGYDLSKGKMVDIGVTVGTIAAQSIGEPGTQLTMRTFHIGGTASGTATETSFTAKNQGTIKLRDIRTLKNRDGLDVVISRKGRLIIVSDDGREVQEHLIEYGSRLLVNEGQKIKAGDIIAEWDVNAKVILTERAGVVRYVDLINHVTMHEQHDETTHTVERTVLDQKGEEYQPVLAVEDSAGNEVAHYYLPTGSILAVENGQKVQPGDILIKMPQEISKTKDITVGGLPRIVELVEARAPKDVAIISDIDGIVSIGGLSRGMRKITVTLGDLAHDYLIPRGKQLNVLDGDRISAGDPLTSGTPLLQDILRILGPDVLQRYIVDRLQEIYRSQGIDINDRHVEIIIRQMMRRVRIVESGDSDFLVGDRIDRIHFKEVNEQLRAQGKRISTAKPVLAGITMASLGTESVISAASFQETTRILSEAAIAGKVDNLYGLKENLVIGKLIPAGTGISSFKKKYLGDGMSDLERQAHEEEERLLRKETVG